jgi:hypothetical protein
MIVSSFGLATAGAFLAGFVLGALLMLLAVKK